MLFRRALCVLQGALSLSSLAAARALQSVSAGQTRNFELSLTWDSYAPDGVERKMILANSQFPGPLLEINQGDDVEILVHNNLPFNTTIHYHGIEQLGTPWSDGMPGLSQRLIEPGASFTYRWKATQYGSYWYHAHERGQIDDGLIGAILIHPTGNQDKPFSLISTDAKVLAALEKAEANTQALVMSDWRHISSEEAWDITVASGIQATCYDAILFNGKGRVDCWSDAKINALLNDAQRALLKAGDATAFTPKGCLPAKVFANVFAAGTPTDISKIPPSVFDVCTATTGQHEVLEFQQSSCEDGSTWVSVDLVATFGLMSGEFSVDGHQMYIYAVDGAYIEPQIVDTVTVFNGNRYSFFLKLEKTADFTARFASAVEIQMISGTATIRLNESKASARKRAAAADAGGQAGGRPSGNDNGAANPTNSSPGNGNGNGGDGGDSAHAGNGDDGTDAIPDGQYINDAGAFTSNSVSAFDETAMRPYPAQYVSPTSDKTYTMHMRLDGKSYLWAINETMYPTALDTASPLLFESHPVADNGVTMTTLNDTWIDLIFVTDSVPMPPHPIHKHGNKMWLLGRGMGEFQWSSAAEAQRAVPGAFFSTNNPPMRDSYATLPATKEPSWMIVRYHVTNPGAWFLHCHIVSHLMGGMGYAILDGVDHWPQVPAEYLDMA